MLNKGLNLFKAIVAHFIQKRPLVFYWDMKIREGKDFQNAGDMLTPYLIQKITNKSIYYIEVKSKIAGYIKHLIAVGSIIQYARRNTFVWGTGAIKMDLTLSPANYLAVRGHLTGNLLEKSGMKDPKVYGDPAILLPLLYASNIKNCKKFKVGIIPHYSDEDCLTDKIICNQEVKIISLKTDNIEVLIDKICDCELIVSTSLHGLIIAQAYGIQACWWKYSNNLSGDDTKFYDYASSLNIKIKPWEQDDFIFNNFCNIPLTYFSKPDEDRIKSAQIGLLKVFPYKIRNKGLNNFVRQ